MKLLFEHLFEFVRDCVLSEGGDGDAYIVAERHKELADLFAASESCQDNPWFTKRIENPNGDISFANAQEAIIFTATRDHLPPFGSGLCVELGLPWWAK